MLRIACIVAAIIIARKGDGHLIGRWNCHCCKSGFNVLSGTIFEKTNVPLQKWLMAIGLITNAKKSLSSCQLARNLDVTQPTAWYIQQRIRAHMAMKDEPSVGGKPRKRKKSNNAPPNNLRGRGTRNMPVSGAGERGGRVVALVATDLSGNGVLTFIKDRVDPDGSLLITDELRAYHAVGGTITHAGINHTERYADGATHTNTIEGFWSLLKRAWYGSRHHDNNTTRRFMPRKHAGSTTDAHMTMPLARLCGGALYEQALLWRLPDHHAAGNEIEQRGPDLPGSAIQLNP